jgi:mono/diheme cytochrome c family protein
MKRHGLLIWGIVLVIVGLIGIGAANLIGWRSGAGGSWWCPLCGQSTRDGGRGYRLGPSDTGRDTDSTGDMMGPGGYMMRDFRKAKYSSNGERIFLTGQSESGGVSGGFGMMRLGCANCHRADGSGDLAFPDGTVTADIRHDALAEEGFTDATIKRAITDGVDEKGDELSSYMPRWTMSNKDLNDLVAYLKTL